MEARGLMITSGSGVEKWAPPQQLLELAGEDMDLIYELILAFQGDTEVRLGKIRSALAEGNLKAIRAEAHSIKGSAGQIGAAGVASACLELERNVDAAANGALADLVRRLEARVAETSRAMTGYTATQAVPAA